MVPFTLESVVLCRQEGLPRLRSGGGVQNPRQPVPEVMTLFSFVQDLVSPAGVEAIVDRQMTLAHVTGDERLDRFSSVADRIISPGDDQDRKVVRNAHFVFGKRLVELGRIELTAPVADDAREQKQIIFDPIPRVDGIEASADPLLELRAAIYLISGRRRRAA
jgi:hypothetical protein